MRLIRKRAVADSIAKYDISVRNMIGQWTVEENLIDHYRTAAARIFDAVVFDQMLDENANVIPGSLTGNPRLQSYTERDLYEWNYRLYSAKTINKANRRDLGSLLRQAENLLKTLEKEYQLD